MRALFTNIYYSFPVQLLVLHLRSNLFATLVWLFLFLVVSGKVLQNFGAQYLFLAPEYMGSVGFWSFFIVGLTYGGFVMTWNLTTYLLDAYHFPFLASLARPFRKYCVNNAVLPLVFLVFLLGAHVWFEGYFEYKSFGRILWESVALLLGTFVSIAVILFYLHWTNKDVFGLFQKPPRMPLKLDAPPGRRRVEADDTARREQEWRVDTYLAENLSPRLVRSVAHYDKAVIQRVFGQNHTNVLLLILLRILALVGLGLFIDYQVVRIPAAASALLFLSVTVSVVGALTYWFGRWRVILAAVFLLTYNFITSHDWFNHRNAAFGLNYEQTTAEYSLENLKEICSPENVETDRRATLEILENWRERATADSGAKPKMVLFCVSGGGLKASLFTLQVLRHLDRVTDGRFDDQTVLMSGASGGMIGSAYYRELLLRERLGLHSNPADTVHLNRIGRDLLNSIAVGLVTNDIFLPFVHFSEGEHRYVKDRGYLFEQQLRENLSGAFDRQLHDYRRHERAATIPLLFITPSILNDGRRMIVSPQGVSYMMAAPIALEEPDAVEIDAVDFGRLLAGNEADSLRFSTALRMNATYPYVLPSVVLPTEPEVELVDAGFRDNFGLKSATRFVHNFDEWIREHTSGVVLVQVRAFERNLQINDPGGRGDVERIFDPLGIAGQVISLQDYEHDNSIGFMYDLLGPDFFEIIRFNYRPGEGAEEAPISFHLTRREKEDVLRSVFQEENRAALERLENLLSARQSVERLEVPN